MVQAWTVILSPLSSLITRGASVDCDPEPPQFTPKADVWAPLPSGGIVRGVHEDEHGVSARGVEVSQPSQWSEVTQQASQQMMTRGASMDCDPEPPSVHSEG